MLTRREVIASALASLPAIGQGNPRSRDSAEIRSEADPLSRESGAGFERLLKSCASRPNDLIILPASRALTFESARNLQARARAGIWVILESGLAFESELVRLQQRQIWESTFGLSCPQFIEPPGLYVQYEFPDPTLVRGFDVATSVLPSFDDQVVATVAGQPTCCIRRVGRGGILFLGSMLGPGLVSGEPEAHKVGASLIRSIAQL